MTQLRPKTARTAELLSIQYLRGLAALTVLVSHTLQWPLPQMSQALLRTGRLGVEVFFVISGFIITQVGGDGAFDPLRFARRRALRIVPLYWSATIAVAVMALILPSLFRTTVPTPLGLLESLFFIPSEMPKAPLLGVGWTLDYEVFFYLVFACLSAFGSELRTLLICAGMAVLILIGQLSPHAGDFQYFYTSPSLLGFALGTVLAQAHRHGMLARLVSMPPALLSGVVVLLTAGFYLVPAIDDGRAPLYFHIIMSSTAIAIVGSALVLEQARKLRPMAALHYLGDASYSIYLFHLFAVGAGWAIARRLLPLASPVAYLGAALLTMAAALLAGLAAHYLLERPLLRIGKRPVRKTGPLPGIEAAAA